MKHLFITAFFAWSLSSLNAQVNTGRMDSLFNALDQNDLAAGTITITENGYPVYQRSFGKNQTPQTEYQIGSISKVFTAVMVYQAIDEKKLRLSDTLSRYYPDLPNAGKITIAELLGHRSGLANFTNHTDFDHWKDQPKTPAELRALIARQPVDFAPGEKADYNNSNFLLLGYILEQIFHKTYQQLLRERIIVPLALKETYYGDHAGFTGTETPSYKYFNNGWKQDPAVYLDNFGGAGAVISTPADLCRLITALFAGKLVSAASLDTMKGIGPDGYGHGLFPYGNKAHPGLGHNGKTEGFASSLQYYPERRLAIAYCTNAEVYPKNRILDNIYRACFGIPDTIPGFKPVAISTESLQSFAGTYAAGENMKVTVVSGPGKLVFSFKGTEFDALPVTKDLFWNKSYGFFFHFPAGAKKLQIEDVDDIYELSKAE